MGLRRKPANSLGVVVAPRLQCDGAMRFLAPLTFALLAACSASSGSAIDRTVFTENVCVSGSYPLAGVTFSSPDAYVAIVDVRSGTGALGTPGRNIVAERGVACARATDAPACADAIAKATTTATTWVRETCGGAGCAKDQIFFVVESAGVVQVVDTKAALVALVAPVDGASDAVLLAQYTQDLDGVDCTKAQARKLADGSWEVFLGHGDAKCTDRVEKVVHVGKDGATSVSESTTRAASETCLYP